MPKKVKTGEHFEREEEPMYHTMNDSNQKNKMKG